MDDDHKGKFQSVQENVFNSLSDHVKFTVFNFVEYT